jgi:hypothetical protein
MATSGVYTYSINRDTLIKAVFRGLGVFNDDAPPPPTDVANAVQALNLMIKQWMSEGTPLWCVTNLSVPLVANQIVYPLTAVFKPLKVLDGRLSYLNGLDVPLTQISRSEYNMLGNKANPGVPNSFYYDPQTTQGNLYLYLAAQDNLNTVNLTVQRPLADMVNSIDDFDFPIENLNAVKFGLMNELILEYDVPIQKAAAIAARADKLRESMFDFSQEEASTSFSPSWR